MKLIILFAFAVSHLHGKTYYNPKTHDSYTIPEPDKFPGWCDDAKNYCQKNIKNDRWNNEYDACVQWSYQCNYFGIRGLITPKIMMQPWYCDAAQQKCVYNSDNIGSGQWLEQNNYWNTSMEACMICLVQCPQTNCNKPWWCEAAKNECTTGTELNTYFETYGYWNSPVYACYFYHQFVCG